MGEGIMDGIASGTTNQTAASWRWRAPWILKRRNGPARGIYNRQKEGDRFSGKQIFSEIQWRRKTLVAAGGFSAYQAILWICGCDPVDLYGWEGQDEDLAFAQGTSLSGQLVQQWELRMMAQEAALEEIAASGVRRSLAFKKPCTCTDVEIGDTVLSYEAQRKKSTPRREGPAVISDIDGTGATAKFQSQIFNVARICVREKGEEKDVEDAELVPVRTGFRWSGADLGSQLRHVDVGEDMAADREDGNSSLSTGTPDRGSGHRPEMIPAPEFPPLSAQLPSPHLTMD